MHELSLAQNLIDQLLQLASQHQAERISRLVVVIGPFSGIVVDSFAFGFQALKQEHPTTREAELELETPPPEHLCLDCRAVTTGLTKKPGAHPRDFHDTMSRPLCSSCGSTRLSPQGGTELILKQLEME